MPCWRRQLKIRRTRILVVDQNGQITAFNRHFVDMWNIPPELMKGSYEPVLQIGASFMKNENEFLNQVHALYDRPEASYYDELETKDGRMIDRHSAPLYDERKALSRSHLVLPRYHGAQDGGANDPPACSH